MLRSEVDELLASRKGLQENQTRTLQRLAEERGHRLLGNTAVNSDKRPPLQSRSQYAEEVWAWEHLGCPLTGYYVEVGAHDGTTFSNTHFLDGLGWDGLLIEANPDLAKTCRQRRARPRVVHAALTATETGVPMTFHIAEGAQGVDLLSFSETNEAHRRRIASEGGRMREVQVPTATMGRLIAESSPRSVDFVSIDVEGAELDVPKGLDLGRWRPKVVVVEDNSGGQDPTVPNFMQQSGYTRVHRLGCNDIYAPVLNK